MPRAGSKPLELSGTAVGYVTDMLHWCDIRQSVVEKTNKTKKHLFFSLLFNNSEETLYILLHSLFSNQNMMLIHNSIDSMLLIDYR